MSGLEFAWSQSRWWFKLPNKHTEGAWRCAMQSEVKGEALAVAKAGGHERRSVRRHVPSAKEVQ